MTRRAFLAILSALPFLRRKEPAFRVSLLEISDWEMELMEQLIKDGELPFSLISST